MSAEMNAEYFVLQEDIDPERELGPDEAFSLKMSAFEETLNGLLKALEDHNCHPNTWVGWAESYIRLLDERFRLERAYYRHGWATHYENLMAAANERKDNGQRKLDIKRHDHAIFLAKERGRSLHKLRRSTNEAYINRLERQREELVAKCWDGAPYQLDDRVSSLSERVFGLESQH